MQGFFCVSLRYVCTQEESLRLKEGRAVGIPRLHDTWRQRILSAPVQLDLFQTANITLEVQYRLNQKNWRPPSWAYKRFRKRIETVFSQLNDQFMMIRNYAKQPWGLFTRMAAKVAAFTMLQYFNHINHRPIGQVKYALI